MHKKFILYNTIIKLM